MTQITPVLLGGDIGVYAIAREFFEAFGTTSICLTSNPIPAITQSAICEVRPLANTHDPQMVKRAFVDLENEVSDGVFVTMANFDATAHTLATLAPELSDRWVVPFPDLTTMNRVSDKQKFYEDCAELGIDIPRTQVVDFANADSDEWQVPQTSIPFPLVAKTSSSAAYAETKFAGKKKIYFIEDQAELDRLWGALKHAGFRSTFLLQELIPGGNTAMRSVTAYVDSNGEVTMLASAHVLLEDHLPTMIGNPVAMITQPFNDLFESARKYLQHVGYRGFANFDVKVDPRTGREVFFEVNPRIGRNSYYVAAGGVNPMEIMVRDHVFGESLPLRVMDREILYSLVPFRLLTKYVQESDLSERIHVLKREKKIFDPLFSTFEKSVRRNMMVRLQKLNHFRKFAQYYPKPTDTSY
ncbi:carboxylate--amine ligase [Arcanobacterium ihumii]|uniref:carboxylate--amine ligase n=1 Tax=Arcanobacterium ihumii TaxID=2138162 RepID=UPI000F5425CB|nr:carboxylate--amine ligase [Arcanobacterium ihumii]